MCACVGCVGVCALMWDIKIQCTSDSENAGDYLLFWAKHIMGHFLGLFEGPLNFLFYFDNEKKKIFPHFQNQRYINSYEKKVCY